MTTKQKTDTQPSYRERLGHTKYEDPGVDCKYVEEVDHKTGKMKWVEAEPITEQQHKDDCDINTLMRKFTQTGELPNHVNSIQAAYGDFSNVPDYQTALNNVIRAEEAFMELPAETRREYKNDPAELLRAVQSNDPKEREKAQRLGLLKPEKVSVSPITSSKGGPPEKSGADDTVTKK